MTRIVRWNPFHEVVDMQRQLDRVFDEMNRGFGDAEWTNNGYHLAMDVNENDDTYVVKANLPGINVDDINITLHENVLTVSAEINQEDVAEGERRLVTERRYGRFQRSMRLPQTVNADNVVADYEDGVLTLTLPKSEAAKPRQIAVNNRQLLTNEN